MAGPRTVIVDYQPTAKQNLLHGSDADESLYGGAAGGGKSKALVMDAFFRACRTPGLMVYLFRRTYRELEDTLIREARRSIPLPAVGKYVGGEHEIRLHNGSFMLFRHCENDGDKEKYQGAEIHALYIDELTHFPKDVYEYLKTRLRAPKAIGVKPVVRCTANPGGVGHAWVKDYFVDPHPGGGRHIRRVYSKTLDEYQDRVVEFIPAKVTDNPHISADYVFELEQKPDALRRALLEGNWDAFEGQVFTEWRNDPEHYRDRRFTHVIDPFPIPADWRRYRSFDFGYSRPFSVGWWAADPQGRLYRFSEWYGCQRDRGIGSNVGARMQPGKIAEEIAAFEKQYMPGLPVIGIADPSIFDESRGESVAQLMARHGVYFDPADNTRIAGKMQFHYRLQFDENGYPGMYVFKTCRDFIRTIPALTYNTRVASKVEDVDTECEDHAYDDARYMFMLNPMPERRPFVVPQKQYDPLEIPEPRKRYLP